MKRWSQLIIFAAIGLLVACGVFEKKPDEVAGMTDEEVKQYIRRLGGVPLTPGMQTVKLERGFDVNPGLGGISVTYVIRDNCLKYCWTQVVRKSLDGKVVKKPSQLVPNPTPAEKSDPDFPDLPKEDEKITDDGYVVDHLCHPTLTGRAYIDRPGFPDDLFGRNAINKNAKVFVAEFELCLRCDNPADPPNTWKHCLKWYIVKIRNSKGTSTYLITTDGSSDEPSPEFKRAVDKWTH